MRLINFFKGNARRTITLLVGIAMGVGVVVGVSMFVNPAEDDQNKRAVQAQPQEPHENDPGFTLRFTDQPRPKNPTPLEYCEFAVAVDPDLEEVGFSTVHDRSVDDLLVSVTDEFTFSDGTFVLSDRNGFSNPWGGGYRVNHNLRVIRADGTATLANYGFAAGDACVVSEWHTWGEGAFDAHKSSETLYYPDGTAVRVEMVPNHAEQYARGGNRGADGEVYDIRSGITFTGASIISRDGVVTDISVPEQGTSVNLENGMVVTIIPRATSVHFSASERD